MKKPFINVQKLTIFRGKMSRKLQQINICFPKLTCLELIGTTQLESIAVNFLLLKELTIRTTSLEACSTIKQIIRLNPQLKSLNLDCKSGVDFLSPMSSNLVQLEKLTIWLPANVFPSADHRKIRFQTVTEFTFHLTYHKGPVYDMHFVFPNLQHLNVIDLNHLCQWSKISDFICECDTIRTLDLTSSSQNCYDLTIDNVEWIIQRLPKLMEIEFCAKAFS